MVGSILLNGLNVPGTLAHRRYYIKLGTNWYFHFLLYYNLFCILALLKLKIT